MVEWNIQSRAHACQSCGRTFQDAEVLHTVLFDERDAYRRLDVCEACWQSDQGQGSDHRRGFISHWQTRYESPPAVEPDPIQKDTAETLLRKLIGRNDPTHAGAVFILAVMLERKRLLKAKAQSIESGHRILIYEHARTGDVFTVPDPALRLDQLEAVQRDVAFLLEHGLSPTALPAAGPGGDLARGNSAPSEPPAGTESSPATGDSTPANSPVTGQEETTESPPPVPS